MQLASPEAPASLPSVAGRLAPGRYRFDHRCECHKGDAFVTIPSRMRSRIAARHRLR